MNLKFTFEYKLVGHICLNWDSKRKLSLFTSLILTFLCLTYKSIYSSKREIKCYTLALSYEFQVIVLINEHLVDITIFYLWPETLDRVFGSLFKKVLLKLWHSFAETVRAIFYFYVRVLVSCCDKHLFMRMITYLY